MTTQIQRRRGTTAQHSTFTGAVGEVTVDTDKEVLVVHDGAQVGGYPQMRENGSNSALALGSAGTPSLKFAGDTNTGIYSPGADQLALSTNGTGRLFVDSSGNISVNTASTTAASTYGMQLGVRGTIGMFPTTQDIVGSSVSLRSALGSSSVEDIFKYETTNWINAAAYGTALSFFTRSTTSAVERMRLDSSGRLGIGTTAVDVKTQIVKNALTKSWSADGDDVLAIENSGTTNVDFRSGSSSSTYLMFSDGDARARGYVAYLHSSDALLLGAANSERARIDSSGRLLVGTSSAREGIVQIESSTGFNEHRLNITGNRNTDSQEPSVWLNKTRSTTNGGFTIVQNNDRLGTLFFAGADGSALQTAAFIRGEVDGTPGANDMPGRLVFSTTADGASSPTERMRITSSGQLLVNTSSARYMGKGTRTQFQFESADNSATLSLTSNAANQFGPVLTLAKSRANSIGSVAVVQGGDELGALEFNGADGTDIESTAASIKCFVDSSPGTNDMPGRLVFSTTADGASSPTERMRITSTGQLRLAGAGITFNGDTATANELDDYEEGTFTPTLGGNATYSYQTGEYVKVGRIVFIRLILVVSTIGTGSTTVISGLPFTANNLSGAGNFRGSVGYFANIAVNTINLLWTIGSNTSNLDFTTVATSGSTSNGSGAIFANGAHVQLTATYMTA